jgi:hypothetical protein
MPNPARSACQYVYRNAPRPIFLAPKSIETSDFISITGTQAIIEHGLTAQGAEPKFFIWGNAQYADVFGRQHFIEWCYRLRYDSYRGERIRASFIQWGDYNRSDEDDT